MKGLGYMKKSMILVLFLIGLVGCSGASFETDKFTNNDLCIVHTDSSKEVCYGNKRADAEKVIGKAIAKNDIAENAYVYDFGVTVSYRDDAVVGMILRPASEGIYETARGASIGELKNEIKNLYGSKYAVDKAERNLAYYYNSKTNKLIKELDSAEELENLYLVSFRFDTSGYAEDIALMDYQWAMLMK